METEIIFVNDRLKKHYESLKDSKEFRTLYNSLERAFADIMKDHSCGIALEKYRIPKKLLSSGFNNVWKYDLPMGWRLLYSVKGDRIFVQAIILDWCDHKDYEKIYSGKK